MDNRIKKVREDIRRAEAKKREMEEYIKTLKMRERQLCDDEILKTVRAMAGKGDVLRTLQELTEKNREEPEGDEADSENKQGSAFLLYSHKDEGEDKDD